MPLDKRNLIMAKATGLIFSLLDVAQPERCLLESSKKKVTLQYFLGVHVPKSFQEINTRLCCYKNCYVALLVDTFAPENEWYVRSTQRGSYNP